MTCSETSLNLDGKFLFILATYGSNRSSKVSFAPVGYATPVSILLWSHWSRMKKTDRLCLRLPHVEPHPLPPPATPHSLHDNHPCNCSLQSNSTHDRSSRQRVNLKHIHWEFELPLRPLKKISVSWILGCDDEWICSPQAHKENFKNNIHRTSACPRCFSRNLY